MGCGLVCAGLPLLRKRSNGGLGALEDSPQSKAMASMWAGFGVFFPASRRECEANPAREST